VTVLSSPNGSLLWLERRNTSATPTGITSTGSANGMRSSALQIER